MSEAELDPQTSRLIPRCGIRATERGDAMIGTAFPAPRVLMVEQPGGWGVEGLLESRFDRATARELVHGFSYHGVRVVAVRRPGRVTEPAQRRWAFADCRPHRRSMTWGLFTEDSELLDLDPDTGTMAGTNADLGEDDGQGTPDLAGNIKDHVVKDHVVKDQMMSPTYLVCTHGTHDVCCAIEGRPVAAALNEIRPGNAWECSHLGGDRFAANVLVLPLGLVYGRVSVEAAADLAAATDRDEVLAPMLRGHIGLYPWVQTALAHAHETLGLFGVDDLQVLDSHVHHAADVPDHEAGLELKTVRIATPRGKILVSLRAEKGASQMLTCRAVRASASTVYRPIGLEFEGATRGAS
ncbi:sucrase ferredoxin [Jatrophihabitans sp. DSM 45814]